MFPDMTTTPNPREEVAHIQGIAGIGVRPARRQVMRFDEISGCPQPRCLTDDKDKGTGKDRPRAHARHERIDDKDGVHHPKP